jgi:hypothetical protein
MFLRELRPLEKPVEKTLTIAEKVAEIVSRSADRRPTVVYAFDPSQRDENLRCSKNVLDHEPAAIVMRMFRCLRIDVGRIPDEKVRKLYASTPALYFFDPRGKEIASATGDEATSTAAFDTVLGKVWKRLYEGSREDFTKKIQAILDKRDREEDRKSMLEDRETRLLEGRPDLRKLRELKKEIAEVDAKIREYEAEESAAVAALEYKGEYREEEKPADEEKDAGNSKDARDS